MQICNIEKNIGLADRIIRATAAAVMIGLSAEKKVSSPWRIGMLVFSGVLLATSAIGTCPAYTALDISTKTDGELF